MPNPAYNGRHPGNGDQSASPPVLDPLAEAESIRSLLSEAQSRLSHLIASLKQQRRQARAVAAAVASIRQLPPLSP